MTLTLEIVKCIQPPVTGQKPRLALRGKTAGFLNSTTAAIAKALNFRTHIKTNVVGVLTYPCPLETVKGKTTGRSEKRIVPEKGL